ncbi:MAG TPA: AI-2E family transporter [Rhizomicrobium sp.]|jgi:predicted PurR-regulated permease PerM|nr:AI-2E family transporter [Rhizomicrobium sp.]
MAETPARISEKPAAPDAQLRFAASVVIAAIVAATIYLARPVLIPLALAIVLAFALAPIVSTLRRFHVGHAVSVLLTALFAVAVIGVIIIFIGSQLAHLAADLPRYQHTISQKIHALEQSAKSNGAIARASALLENVNNEFSANPPETAPAVKGALHALAPHERELTPVPVVIRPQNATPLQIIGNIVRPLLEPLATIGIAMIFVVFILLQKEDLRDRFIWMAGAGDLQRAKTALDDGAQRLSRYLLTQTALNTTFGTFIGTGLWLIGVPQPWLWGLVAGILRFIPYVGVPLAAITPLVLSLAVGSGWSMVLWTAALYFILEPIMGQFVEPFAYGQSVGLSPVAVVVAATFWTWAWGPVGLLLSTPLTLCFAVLGRHVERLRFLDVLLGNRPPLAHEESVYLRILSGDPDDAARLAEIYLKDHTLCDYYDVALKALVLAQGDLESGALDDGRSAEFKLMIHGLIQNLADHEEVVPARGDAASERCPPEKTYTDETLPPTWRDRPVLCVAGRGPLDEAAALLLVHLLEKRGIGARMISAEQASAARIVDLDVTGVRLICLSYLESTSGAHAHYLMRRLRRRIPDAEAIAGCWGLSDDNSGFLDAFGTTEAEVVTNFHDAVARIMAAIDSSPPDASGKDVQTSPGRALSEAAA